MAIVALGDIGDFRAVDPIKNCLKDPSKHVRTVAKETLANKFNIKNRPRIKRPDKNKSYNSEKNNKDINKCHKCGHPVDPSNKFCGNCGAPLQKSEIICPKCSTVLPSNVNFCTNCGTAVKN